MKQARIHYAGSKFIVSSDGVQVGDPHETLHLAWLWSHESGFEVVGVQVTTGGVKRAEALGTKAEA